jgi:hypothetical protein
LKVGLHFSGDLFGCWCEAITLNQIFHIIWVWDNIVRSFGLVVGVVISAYPSVVVSDNV